MATLQVRSSRSSHNHHRSARLARALLALLIATVGILGFVAVTALWDLPNVEGLVARSSPTTTKIYDRNGRLLFEVLDPLSGMRTRVALDELSPHLVRAVLATEDAGFYDHPGVAPRAIARALVTGIRQRRMASGASTITQQLARLVLMEESERSQRTLHRKAREMALAVVLTRRYPKDEILERYLNEAYFGQLAYGAEAAARTYFGKPARQLDLAEAALLAGLIQAPATYNPLVDLDAALRRQTVVLHLMVEAGMATQEEADLAAAERVQFASGDEPLLAPHFVTWVRNELEARYGTDAVHRGRMHVVTSLDLDLQREAETIVRRHLAELQRREPGKPDYHVSSAALVAVDPETGQVLAMVGSADYFDASIDGAVNVTMALRQPGSALKPITYATAFDTDRWGVRPPSSDVLSSSPMLPFTPATVLSDVPTAFRTREGEPYRPVNYDRKWHGPVALRRALATSSNLVAVKVMDAVGVDAFIDTAQAVGLTTLADRERYGLALTLGGGEVRLLELTAAYGALGNGGRRVEPIGILAVVDTAEHRAVMDDLERWHAVTSVASSPTLSPRAAFLVTDILSDDRARIPAFGEHSVLELNRPAAAKTGTTTDFRDNWTVGYTPDLAVGVWVGNADNSPMRYISGITGAGPIWHDFMQAALRGKPARGFTRPDGLVRLDVCTASGGLPTDLCPRRQSEWFIAGTEPRHLDTAYRTVAIDARTGLAWEDGCRGPRTDRVFRVLPFEAIAWGRSAGIAAPPDTTCLGAPVAQVGPRGAANAASASPETGSAAGLQVGHRDDAVSDRPGLVITHPAPNTTFAISAQLPIELQRIDVAAAASYSLDLLQVTILVDDTELGTFSRPPYRTGFALQTGAHIVRAVGRDASGQSVESEPVLFNVLGAEPLTRD